MTYSLLVSFIFILVFIGIPVSLIVFIVHLIVKSRIVNKGEKFVKMQIKTGKNIYKKINGSDFDQDLKGDSTE